MQRTKRILSGITLFLTLAVLVTLALPDHVFGVANPNPFKKIIWNSGQTGLRTQDGKQSLDLSSQTATPANAWRFGGGDIIPKASATQNLGSVGLPFATAYVGTISPGNYAMTGGTINNVIIGGSTPLAGTFTTLTGTGLAVPSVIQQFHVQLTAVQLCAMYGTAVDLLAGPGVGHAWTLVGPAHIHVTYGTSVLASGGAVVIQYHGSATAATGTAAATQFTISSATSDSVMVPVNALPTISSGTTSTDAGALEITNATGAFTKTTSTTTADVWFNYMFQ